MPSVPLVVLAALAGALGSHVELADGCILPKSALRSYVDLRSPKIAQVLSTRRPDDRTFEQTIKLTSGATVTFSVYGCSHFGYRFSFGSIPGVTRSTPLPELARIARERLSSVPMRRVNGVWLGDTAEALSDEAIAEAEDSGGGSYLIRRGDAHYSLTVPEPGVLEVEYDFAL